MPVGMVIRKNEYHDSVFLMRVTKRISEQQGVRQVALLMGTEKNKEFLAAIGVSAAELAGAKPGDLVLAVEAISPEQLAGILENLDGWLGAEPVDTGAEAVHTLDEALNRQPLANLAVISIPGGYADREARKALEGGVNVFLFSDNVPLEQERGLKEYAREHGLIVMGPDCGTAIIGGVGIGFANVVRRGPVGVVGASGTGIQEFTCLVHRAGSGISQAIGTGGRDLSDPIGALSLLTALDALEADNLTETIAILSKPPGAKTLADIVPRLQQCRKPAVVCFLGGKNAIAAAGGRCVSARTLDEAAALSVRNVTGSLPPDPDEAGSATLIAGERVAMHPAQRYVRGLFAGGTFCSQAQLLLLEAGITAYSNVPVGGNPRLPDPLRSREDSLVDMGADEFTSGRPHPMIDARLRRERLLTEAADPEVAVLLLDFLLGFNATADPAGDLAGAIREAKRMARRRGGFLSVVASLCGTTEDPQDFHRQAARLEQEGVLLFGSSARAARFAARLALQARGGEGLSAGEEAVPDRRPFGPGEERGYREPWNQVPTAIPSSEGRGGMAGPFRKLLDQGPRVINVGVGDFAGSLRAQGAQVVQVNWSPPAGGDREMMDLLDQLL